MRLHFSIAFHTKYGEKLQICIKDGEKELQCHDMAYDNTGNWIVEIDFFSRNLKYHYQVVNEQDALVEKEFTSHQLDLPHNYKEFRIFDFWNNKNFPENYLTNKILKNKLRGYKFEKVNILKKHTHLFRIEAPLYHPDWRVVIIGSTASLGLWEYTQAIPMMQTQAGVWEAAVEIPEQEIIYYKYALMDIMSGEVFDVEFGDNRWAFPAKEEEELQVRADHYFKFKSYQLFHAAGVAVPVFSLRSRDGFGVGEFPDLKKLADWAAQTSLEVIQVLPVNDTTTTNTWTDSYPYAAISVYALHPQYLSLDALEVKWPDKLKTTYQKEKAQLNAGKQIDYEKVMTGKWKFLHSLFEENLQEILKDKDFKKFIKENESWLLPYAAFCVQRDLYKTPDFNQWNTHKKYIKGKVAAFFSPKGKNYQKAMFHAWIQFQLHLQLTEAVNYMHQKGISVKGDLPIGIYRYSVEAWAEPQLFGMDFQVGAPPDQFTTLGQNWGFPTYNWETMKEDGYQWWKHRFHALEQYFDAMRIDHILGFFRIWRMPVSATQGILGYYYPAIPVTEEELAEKGINFSLVRFCKPFLHHELLNQYFGGEKEHIADRFLKSLPDGTFKFKEEFDSQRKIADYFLENPDPETEEKLLALAANVLFLTEDRNGKTVYHPRFNIHQTDSYHQLPKDQQEKLYQLYLDYFFKRQDVLWEQSAMEKLPVILNATEMLICGEDLGMVPDAVPVVMDRLGITALKVQRMPPGNDLWYDPEQAGYLNVVTASSHDSSTLRQWWLEDRELSKKFFKEQLLQYGTTPWHLEPQLAEIIMKQHLYNEAILAIFPIQEFFATDEKLRNPDLEIERINNPAVFPHYWRYRMHLQLEDLVDEADFNSKIRHWVKDSGRA